MPQMAPISWLCLFFIFFMILLIFNMLNFYCFSYNNFNKNKTLTYKNNKIFNWSW